jgi:hypothetical protein
MNSYYSYSDLVETQKMIDKAAEDVYHASQRPRETKHDTTAFYNFRKKRRGKKR